APHEEGIGPVQDPCSAQKALLEDVVIGWLTAHEHRIPAIRESKLDYNWRFLVEYYATFVPLGKTPHQSVFKAVFALCAQRYGFFPPGTTKKTIKAEYVLRKKSVAIIKRVISSALAEVREGDQLQLMDDDEELFPCPDQAETLPMDEVYELPMVMKEHPDDPQPGDRRQVNQAQVDAMCVDDQKDDEDHMKAQQKVRDAIRKRTRGKQPEPAAPEQKPKAKAKAKADGRKKKAPAAEAEGGGKDNEKSGEKNGDGEKVDGEKVDGEKVDGENDDGDRDGENGGGEKVDAESDGGNGDGKKGDKKGDGENVNASPNKRPTKRQRKPANTAVDWVEKEKELRAAGVPIPADYKGDKKSYTLPGDSDKGQCAVGVLWTTGSFYIYGVPGDRKLPEGLTLNGSMGCTISIKKRGGLPQAWALAKVVAKRS
ncbi:unnamed protein product, partial [Cladocopium goreaui]